jgi:hypothetical protein
MKQGLTSTKALFLIMSAKYIFYAKRFRSMRELVNGHSQLSITHMSISNGHCCLLAQLKPDNNFIDKQRRRGDNVAPG